MNFRILVFDFDGTIADTLGETRRIFNQLAPEYGIRNVTEDEIAELRHLSLKELLVRLEIPKRRVPSLIARGSGMMRANITQLQLISGMAEVLPILRGHFHSFGILTSNTASNVELFLETHQLRKTFDFISSTSKLTGKAKHIRAIRKTFSIKPEEMLYIGDELRDVTASKKAGIPVAAVTWGFNSPTSLAASAPDFLFNQPSDFLRLIPRH
ncbi:MAG: carotenoid oxygenase [Verrucomicrobia bacterium]|nr:MAG: carotenoid oxygenase [Verrucomicrobiota bacterium]